MSKLSPFLLDSLVKITSFCSSGDCPKGNQFLKSFLEGDQHIKSCPKGDQLVRNYPKKDQPIKKSKLPKSPPKCFNVLQLLDVQLQVVANVKIELVTLEAQKDTLFGVIILQSTKFQDCKVNLKDAMGCPRNNNEEIGKIGDFTLIYLHLSLLPFTYKL